VNAGKTFFSESFPDLWLFLMAGLFIGVTMAFPMGLAGLWESHVVPWWQRRRAPKADVAVSNKAATESGAAPSTDHPKLPAGIHGQQA
jgi:urea transport system permease protein